MSTITLKELQKSGILLPQEEMLEVANRSTSLLIGIPKESSFQENRVPLVPSAVALLASFGHRVMIKTEAGKNANFQDKDYSEAGAQIVYSKEEIYKADIVIKVSIMIRRLDSCLFLFCFVSMVDACARMATPPATSSFFRNWDTLCKKCNFVNFSDCPKSHKK